MEFETFWHIVLNIVSESGIWAMLFVILLIILITSNNAREQKYQDIIRALSNSLKKIEEVKEDVEDIKFSMGIGGNSKMQNSVEKTSKGESNDTQRKDKNI